MQYIDSGFDPRCLCKGCGKGEKAIAHCGWHKLILQQGCTRSRQQGIQGGVTREGGLPPLRQPPQCLTLNLHTGPTPTAPNKNSHTPSHCDPSRGRHAGMGPAGTDRHTSPTHQRPLLCLRCQGPAQESDAQGGGPHLLRPHCLAAAACRGADGSTTTATVITPRTTTLDTPCCQQTRSRTPSPATCTHQTPNATTQLCGAHPGLPH